ncbi:hypothetical protein GE21DRAFT_4977 [Neurospora crassa]|uniref:Uncharacterized protein n=1 Tax=Neurospora crassa (strain ATCC 24698 / 74-OR23-1A / CBS 708.71 / DSM 1257 / FGSC 987) TaxID=367110 RepID=Q7S3P6_NEUCR|nr:hypothetical protein NCU08191 [Neurospora crassa OR74A]EAA30045.1 hypothetical protein NCU08191 [Neurospora crassa OR74A]KHE86438.1 hypothetical protein GE21DRAFT_4977 [Neurospora crassa]|eukprot:XP_959281.1 hypothetical protein NCU08191 [Neurospora crassa OR74A]
MASPSSSQAPDRTPRNPRGPAVRTDAGASDRAANRLPDLAQLMDSPPEVESLPLTQSNPNQQRRTPSTPVPIPQQESSPASGSDHFYSARQTPAQSESPAPDLATERRIDVDSHAFHENSLVHPARHTERDLERLPRYDPFRNPSASPASRSDTFHTARETPVAGQSPAPDQIATDVPLDFNSYEFMVNSLVHPVRRTEQFEERFDPDIRSRLRGPWTLVGMTWDDIIRDTNDRLLANGAEEKDLICKARHTDRGCTR